VRFSGHLFGVSRATPFKRGRAPTDHAVHVGLGGVLRHVADEDNLRLSGRVVFLREAIVKFFEFLGILVDE
jgi:hypothetical protein